MFPNITSSQHCESCRSLIWYNKTRKGNINVVAMRWLSSKGTCSQAWVWSWDLYHETRVLTPTSCPSDLRMHATARAYTHKHTHANKCDKTFKGYTDLEGENKTLSLFNSNKDSYCLYDKVWNNELKMDLNESEEVITQYSDTPASQTKLHYSKSWLKQSGKEVRSYCRTYLALITHMCLPEISGMLESAWANQDKTKQKTCAGTLFGIPSTKESWRGSARPSG